MKDGKAGAKGVQDAAAAAAAGVDRANCAQCPRNVAVQGRCGQGLVPARLADGQPNSADAPQARAASSERAS